MSHSDHQQAASVSNDQLHLSLSSDVPQAEEQLPGRSVVPLPLLQPEPGRLDPDKTKKLDEVLAACRSNDLASLTALTETSGGLIDDERRRAAWPLFLNCSTDRQDGNTAWETLDRHRDEDQVSLDVNRSFVNYPRGENDVKLEHRKRELSDSIVEILRRHPYLCYFQGYHDIVQVLLLVLGVNGTVRAAERLSILHIRDFMLPTMTGALSHLSLLPAILDAADHELYVHLSHSAPFYFALSATLTLYAHEIQEYSDIARLFDYLLAHESVVSIYLFAVIICSRKKQLLELEPDEHDMLHSILSKLPQPLDLDRLITDTTRLHREHPPESLRKWHAISPNSALKTTHDAEQLRSQTLADGKLYFEKHAEEIRRQELRAKQLDRARRAVMQYRRPVIMTGAAIFVAVLAIYLRSKPPSGFHVVIEWTSRALFTLQRGMER